MTANRRLARALRSLLCPRYMSLEWLEQQDQRDRDDYEGPCMDWTTAPAAFTAARERTEEPAS